jgi:serine/threonine protein kinase
LNVILWPWLYLALLLPPGFWLWRRRGVHSLKTQLVPGYSLTGELGRGATAVVHRARHDATGQSYAVKMLSAPDADSSARMRREMKLLRDLQHPGIVSLCDYGEYRGKLYLILELIEGETLRRHLGRGRMAQAQALGYCRELLEALNYAHQHHVWHRDLKPENLMVRRDGRLQLLDFGFSRNAQRNTFETLDNSVAGTPAYLAPERLCCNNLAASDQYSLGLIAYEMLTGQPAIPPGLSIAEVITRQLHVLPPSPRSLDASIPERVDEFVMRLLAKKPEDRFESMASALEAFRAVVP